MSKQLLKDMQEKADKTLHALREELKTVRAGRANPSILDNIMVSYYGTLTPLKQVATISAPEARLLTIQPWDKSIMKDIEKEILGSNLGITPSNDGNIIRLPFPQLTEDRRKELTKVVKEYGEKSKITIRAIRRDCVDDAKKMEKNSEISEDDLHSILEEIQNLTDKLTKEVDKIVSDKETELMEI
ncbi:ribosome recycling factor [uncultured Finegoldia sp.]|uniref:ribosome recycling factor n=1 Tax=uncultured Finegoldia sp. TaxID=328009 RepID=UPI002610C3BE|nr:ribosome recycling factor [uncultured Finegoldia sp.]